MNRFISLALALALILALAACGSPNESTPQGSQERDEEFLTKSVHAYLLMTKRKSADEVTDMSKEQSEILRSMAEYIKDSSLKNEYLRAADLIDSEDRDELTSFLNGKGVDPEPSREPSALENSLDDLHQTYGDSLLDMAQLYLEASDVSSENRNSIKESFDKNRMGIHDDHRELFDQLGEFIQEDDRAEATALYERLRELYN